MFIQRLLVLTALALVPIAACASNPTDPYNMKFMPPVCDNSGFYPCIYQGRLITNSVEDPRKVDDKGKLKPLKPRLCPFGEEWGLIVEQQKFPEPAKVTVGCRPFGGKKGSELEPVVKEPEPERAPTTVVHSELVPKTVPVEKIEPKEESEEIFSFVTADRVLCLIVGFLICGLVLMGPRRE